MIRKWWMVAGVVALLGCVKKDPQSNTPSLPSSEGIEHVGEIERGTWANNVDIYEDGSHNVVCYVYRSYGISCIERSSK